MQSNAVLPKPPVSNTTVKEDFKTLPLSKVEKNLGSSPDGLGQAKATKRLVQYGPNEIEEKKTSALLKFRLHFWGPILVPGDLIRLRLGDIVPADACLLESDEVSVDQSALAGESLPVARTSGDAVFFGSIIQRRAVPELACTTGGKICFGKTAELVRTTHTVSHFQKAVLKIGSYLINRASALAAIVIAVGIYRPDPILITLQFALVLAVAPIPVAMPALLSVTMAVSARLLAKKQAIVSKLVAIAALAGVDVMCPDKTGTPTQNKLTLEDPSSVDKVPAAQVILSAAIAPRSDNDETIDLAVLGGLKGDEVLQGYQIQQFQPFYSVHKRTGVTVKGADGSTFKVPKGAPWVLLELATNTAAVKAAVDKAVTDFAARGLRLLRVARAGGDGKGQPSAVLPLYDPPREDAQSTVATARQMGVEIKMLTGAAVPPPRDIPRTEVGMQAACSDCCAPARSSRAFRGRGGPQRRPKRQASRHVMVSQTRLRSKVERS